MTPEKPEAVEAEATELETLSHAEDEVAAQPPTLDQMDATIQISAKIEAFAKAMDTITNTVIKRSYAGDWVIHAKKDDPEEKKRANMGSAAAERIAAFLGIREQNWTPGVKEWSDDRKNYTWIYEADFSFGNRTIHAIGRAGTRDKFFSKARGQVKPIDEIQEDDIRAAAFRNCRKEGVRQLLGLRSIPISKLQALGYDINLIAYAGFENAPKNLSADAEKAGADGLSKASIIVSKIERTEGKGWIRHDVVDKSGVKYALFAPDASKRLAVLLERQEDQMPVTIYFTVKVAGDKQQFKNYDIKKVEGVAE